MKIDFDTLPTQVLEHFKGGEKHYDAEMYTDSAVKIMRGHLVPGASIGMHTHEDSSETIFITSGTGTVVTPEGTETVEPGMCTYCPKGASHSLQNRGTEPLHFYAVVAAQ